MRIGTILPDDGAAFEEWGYHDQSD